jgi:anti-anti-sigma factor
VTGRSHDGSEGPAAATVAEVVLTGELDLATYQQARERVHQAEQGRPALLVIDLAALEFVDSTGVRLVLDADLRAREQGRRLGVRLGTGSALRVFQTLGLLDVLDVVPPRDPQPPEGRAAP